MTHTPLRQIGDPQEVWELLRLGAVASGIPMTVAGSRHEAALRIMSAWELNVERSGPIIEFRSVPPLLLFPPQ